MIDKPIICAISGFVILLSEARKNWKGNWVRKDLWDPKPAYLLTPDTTDNISYPSEGLNIQKSSNDNFIPIKTLVE